MATSSAMRSRVHGAGQKGASEKQEGRHNPILLGHLCPPSLAPTIKAGYTTCPLGRIVDVIVNVLLSGRGRL
jgi:hypothetical protein